MAKKIEMRVIEDVIGAWFYADPDDDDVLYLDIAPDHPNFAEAPGCFLCRTCVLPFEMWSATGAHCECPIESAIEFDSPADIMNKISDAIDRLNDRRAMFRLEMPKGEVRWIRSDQIKQIVEPKMTASDIGMVQIGDDWIHLRKSSIDNIKRALGLDCEGEP